MSKALRGFAVMDKEMQREFARLGGKAAHRKGTCHEWTKEEAQAAGRKGGQTRARRKAERDAAAATHTPTQHD